MADEEYLMGGITNGFDIVEKGCLVEPVWCKNYKSATLPPNRVAVDLQIQKELSEGRYILCSEKPTVVSALGAIPNFNLSVSSEYCFIFNEFFEHVAVVVHSI